MKVIFSTAIILKSGRCSLSTVSENSEGVVKNSGGLSQIVLDSQRENPYLSTSFAGASSSKRRRNISCRCSTRARFPRICSCAACTISLSGCTGPRGPCCQSCIGRQCATKTSGRSRRRSTRQLWSGNTTRKSGLTMKCCGTWAGRKPTWRN